VLGVRAEHGAIRAGSPLFLARRPLTSYVTTGLFGAYGPVLADHPDAAHALLAASCRFADEAGASHLHWKVTGPVPASLPAGVETRSIWDTAVLALADTSEAMWNRLPGPMRSKIRKARREGLTPAIGDLGGFYDVLAENMHRKGSPIYGIALLRAILDAFGAGAEIVTLRGSDGRVVAGALAMTHERTVYVPFVSARPGAFPLRPNNLLYWTVIEAAIARGARQLDFGTSIRGASTFQFKSSWHPEVRPVTSLLYAPAGGQPTVDTSGAGVQAGMRLWKALPRAVADWLGPRISRYLV
jgi:CelD/BcsL family acetyltransferase involved in cellulose biosynthesis